MHLIFFTHHHGDDVTAKFIGGIFLVLFQHLEKDRGTKTEHRERGPLSLGRRRLLLVGEHAATVVEVVGDLRHPEA